MYAIIEDGSHQYKVQEGDRLEVQLHDLTDDQKTIEFDKVLMIGDGAKSKIGHPYVSGAKVAATIQREIKGDKLTDSNWRKVSAAIHLHSTVEKKSYKEYVDSLKAAGG